MPTTLHRLRDADLPDVLSLLASSGGTARATVESWRQDRMTALLLGSDSPAPPPRRIDAVMPISRRQISVAPGRTLSAGWLSSNQFATRMSLRRQTRDTFSQWPELLPELDALIVVRRDEGSLASRWYAHTGFQDVLSIRCLYLEMDAPPVQGNGASRYAVRIAGAADVAEWGEEMLAVYRDVYGAVRRRGRPR